MKIIKTDADAAEALHADEHRRRSDSLAEPVTRAEMLEVLNHLTRSDCTPDAAGYVLNVLREKWGLQR